MTDKKTVGLFRIPSAFHTADDLLETAKKLNLPNILLLSQGEDGKITFLDYNVETVAQTNWLLDSMKHVLFK